MSVIGQMDAIVTKEERTDVVKVEKVMRKWCDTAKGKDKTMCYYLGVGDAESVRRRRLSSHRAALSLRRSLAGPRVNKPRAFRLLHVDVAPKRARRAHAPPSCVPFASLSPTPTHNSSPCGGVSRALRAV